MQGRCQRSGFDLRILPMPSHGAGQLIPPWLIPLGQSDPIPVRWFHQLSLRATRSTAVGGISDTTPGISVLVQTQIVFLEPVTQSQLPSFQRKLGTTSQVSGKMPLTGQYSLRDLPLPDLRLHFIPAS